MTDWARGRSCDRGRAVQDAPQPSGGRGGGRPPPQQQQAQPAPPSEEQMAQLSMKTGQREKRQRRPLRLGEAPQVLQTVDAGKEKSADHSQSKSGAYADIASNFFKVQTYQLTYIISDYISQLKMVGMQFIGRKYYRPQRKIVLIATSILQCKKDVMLCADILQKVLRQQSVLELAHGELVLTRNNNKTYCVDDIEKADRSKFSFEQYFMDYYQQQVQNKEPPLLISLLKANDRKSGVSGQILLPTKFCSITSLSDDIRSNLSEMKDLSIHTRVGSEGQVNELKEFMKDLSSNPESQKELAQQNLKFDTKVLPKKESTYPPENCLWQDISKYIKDPIVLATNVNLPKRICDEIIFDYSSNEERCYQVLKKAHNSSENVKLCCWEYVLPYLNKFEDGRKAIGKLQKIYSTDENEKKCLWQDISKHIKDSQILATHVGLPEHICDNIIYDNYINEDRCYHVLEKAHNMSENGKLCCWWSVWPYLNRFQNGQEVIAKFEYCRIAHTNNIKNTFIIGHHHPIDKNFRLESSDCLWSKSVDISSKQVLLPHRLTHEVWSENKEDYCLKLKDLISTTNWLYNSNDECDIIRVLKSTKEKFFLMKGIDHAEIMYLFHSNGILKRHHPQIDFLHRLEDLNVFLHICFANQGNIREVLDGKLEAVRLIQSTYKFLCNNCIHVSIVAFDETLSETEVKDICEECSSLRLIVSKKILENLETYNSWYSEAIMNNKSILRWKEVFYNQGHKPIIDRFKHELFPRIALCDEKVPNFVLTVYGH